MNKEKIKRLIENFEHSDKEYAGLVNDLKVILNELIAKEELYQDIIKKHNGSDIYVCAKRSKLIAQTEAHLKVFDAMAAYGVIEDEEGYITDIIDTSNVPF